MTFDKSDNIETTAIDYNAIVRKEETTNFSWIKLTPAFFILALAGLIIWHVNDLFSITGKPLLDMLLVMAVLNLGFYVAIRVTSGLSFRYQSISIGTFITIQLACFACLKLDGLYGDGRPVFGWRFRSSPYANVNSSNRKIETSQPIRLIKGRYDWPSYRGPMRDGIVSGRTLVNRYENRPIELWRMPIGEGWSSFVTCGDYCFTQEQRGEFEHVTCRAVKTGIEQWTYADKTCFSEVSGGNGPRATPTFHAGKIYSLGATGILNCLNASDGESIWSCDVLASTGAKNLLFGVTSSPLIYNNMCIVCAGGENASLVAYDCNSGELLWSHGSAAASYSSPQLFELCEQKQILIYNAEGLDGHAADTGEQLWHIPWTNQSPDGTNVCQPIQTGENQIFISSGYGAGCALYTFATRDGGIEFEKVWSSNSLNSKFASAVLFNSFIYGIDNGILVCVDVSTGSRKWKGGRVGHGQLLLVGDRLLIQKEKGGIACVQASPDAFHQLGQFNATSRRTWTVPTVSNELLLLRNDREAVCFELKFE